MLKFSNTKAAVYHLASGISSFKPIRSPFRGTILTNGAFLTKQHLDPLNYLRQGPELSQTLMRINVLLHRYVKVVGNDGDATTTAGKLLRHSALSSRSAQWPLSHVGKQHYQNREPNARANEPLFSRHRHLQLHIWRFYTAACSS